MINVSKVINCIFKKLVSVLFKRKIFCQKLNASLSTEVKLIKTMFIFRCLKVKVEPKRPSRLHSSVIPVNYTAFFVVYTLYSCIKNISYTHLPQCHLVPNISYRFPLDKCSIFYSIFVSERNGKLDAAINFVHEVYSSVN